jgi:hypothetical protein
MSRRTVIEVACGILALIVLIMVVEQWGNDKSLLAVANAAKVNAALTIKQQQTVIDNLEKGIKERDAAAQVEVAKYEPARHVKTAKEAVAVLPELITLPEQPKEVTDLPNAPSVFKVGDFVWTPAAMIVNTQRLAECKQHDVLLAACQVDTKDLRGELVASKLKFDAEVEVAKNFEVAAKGGTKVHRVLKVLKPVGCAAAGAAAGSLYKNKTIGASVGAGAGGIFCALF